MNKIISRKLATDAIDGIMTQLYHIALSGAAENAADQVNFVTILQELVQLRHNDDYKTALEQMSMEGFTEYYTLFFDLVNAMGLESVKDLSDWRVVNTKTLPDSINRANKTQEVVELLAGFNALELADVSFTDRMKTIDRILNDIFVTNSKEQEILKVLASMNTEEQSLFINRLSDGDNPLLGKILGKVDGKEKVSLFQFLHTIFLASSLNIPESATVPTIYNDRGSNQYCNARIRKGKIVVSQYRQAQMNGAIVQTGSWELSPFDQVTYVLHDESYTIPALFLTDDETLSAAIGKETLLSIIWGAMQGEFNEDPTGKQIMADIAINFIPIVGQACDARDIAACLHKLINEGRVSEMMVWVTLLLTAIGCIPYAGDVVKGALKAIIKGADDVALMLVRKIGGDDVVRAISVLLSKLDNSLPEIKRIIKQWAEDSVQKGKANTSVFFSKMNEMIDAAAREIRNSIYEFGRKIRRKAKPKELLETAGYSRKAVTENKKLLDKIAELQKHYTDEELEELLIQVRRNGGADKGVDSLQRRVDRLNDPDYLESQIRKNYEQGRKFEKEQFEFFKKKYKNAQEQVTVKMTTPEGKVIETRIDAIGLDDNGDIVIMEFKSSKDAPLTTNQTKAFGLEEEFKNNAIIVGKGKGIFITGKIIPKGTKVKIIRPGDII